MPEILICTICRKKAISRWMCGREGKCGFYTGMWTAKNVSDYEYEKLSKVENVKKYLIIIGWLLGTVLIFGSLLQQKGG